MKLAQPQASGLSPVRTCLGVAMTVLIFGVVNHPAQAGFTYVPVPETAGHATLVSGSVTSGSSGGGEHFVSWQPGIPSVERRANMEMNIEFLQLLGGQGALGSILSADFTFDHIQSRVGDSVWHLYGYEGDGINNLSTDPHEISRLIGRLDNYQVGQSATLALDPGLMMSLVGVASHIGVTVTEETDGASGSFSGGFPSAMAEINFEHVTAGEGVAWNAPGPWFSEWDAPSIFWTGNAFPTSADHTFIQTDYNTTITAPNASTTVQSLTIGGGTGDVTLVLDPIERVTSSRMTTVYGNGTIDLNGSLLVTWGMNLFDGGTVDWNGGILFVVDDFFSTPAGIYEMDDADPSSLTLLSGATMYKKEGIRIGSQQHGRFLVTNASKIYGGSIVLGEQASGDGTLQVQDPGTLIDLFALIIGPEGNGDATIEDGSKAVIKHVAVGGSLLGASSNPQTGGEFTVRDPGTVAEIGSLAVFGTATAEILNGATLNGGGLVIFGDKTSPPVARFSGPGTTANFTSNIAIGQGFSTSDNRGVLRIENQAQVMATAVILSQDALSPDALLEAELYVTGTGSKLTVNDNLIVSGFNGDSLVEVSGGSTIEVHGFSVATLDVGAQATILVSGAGTQWLQHNSIWIAGARNLNTQAPADLGTAQMTIENGAWLIADGELGVFADATVNLTGGGLSAASILDDRSGSFNFLGGELMVGEYIGDLTNAGGTLASIDAPASTQITGDYTQASNGTLRIVLGGLLAGDSFDMITIGGNAVLDGTLEVLLDGLYVPQLGDTFQFLTATSVGGLFDTKLFPVLPGGLELELSSNATSFSLSVAQAGLIPGDLDGDGFVGIDDLTLVLAAWNQNVPPANPQADPSGDGFVGIDDLTLVLGNWNAGTPPTDRADISIPEPGTLIIVVLCTTGLIRWR